VLKKFKFYVIPLFLCIFFLGYSFYLCRANYIYEELQRQLFISDNWETYTNKQYRITFRYPSHWKAVEGYLSERYEGEDGFFQFSAIAAMQLTIDEVAYNDAYHMLMPYGTSPEIKSLIIDNQKARLIIPSEDQSPLMENQAGLIIKYPETVMIGEDVYTHLILWVNKEYIEVIGQSLKFIE
jgi:TolB protein